MFSLLKKYSGQVVASLLIFALALGLVMTPSHAQRTLPTGGTVTQSSVPQYVCNQTQTATSAGNGAAAVSFAGVPNQVFYICSIYIAEVANATVIVGAGPAPLFTTAGLQNNLVWWGDNSALTQGVLKLILDDSYVGNPIPALPGTTFSITNSGGQSTQNVRINVTGFYGPQ